MSHRIWKNHHSVFTVPNPLTTNVPHHIETSQLICIANQLTGFYMRGIWVFTLLNVLAKIKIIINPFQDNVPFLYPLKMLQKPKVFLHFQGV